VAAVRLLGVTALLGTGRAAAQPVPLTIAVID
jgi:hypothetical protein